ncbi:MAG: SIS domain-containing protein [Bdellovibrionales bacterium]|nr:SIS domain-containing protein [Bdellovibrionales bacterium]
MRERAKQILLAEADAIRNVPINEHFERAVQLFLGCHGKVITFGIGKAGYIAKKAASTFSTTGTPAIFLHPGDASHGDVGVIGTQDVALAFSNSGMTREVLETLHFCRRLGVGHVICVTAHAESKLAEASDVVLEIGKIQEPCPLGLTPTASVAAMLALTDALALVVMEQRGFSREDFALRHHGGYIGEQLKRG